MLNRLARLSQDHKKSLLKSTPIGWDHFDIVTRLPRDRFIDYVLQQSQSEELRRLLAPEIAAAAYCTALHLANHQNKNPQHTMPTILPVNMRERDHLIAAARNLEAAKNRWLLSKNPYAFLSAKKALLDACSTESVYRDYVQHYYGQKGWFICPHPKIPDLFSMDSPHTSMIDIAARFLETQIVILLKEQAFSRSASRVFETIEPESDLYCTEERVNYTRPIRYLGYDGLHFIKLKPLGSDESPIIPKEEKSRTLKQSHPLNYTIIPIDTRDPLYPALMNSEGGYALVYLWKNTPNYSELSHVSMQLFTKDHELIAWENGGYISVHPAKTPKEKILYHRTIDDDRDPKTNEICDITFKVAEIHIDAIAAAFLKKKMSDTLKWNLSTAKNTVNCGGLVLDLLINQGGLSADNIKTISSQEQQKKYSDVKDKISAVSGKYQYCDEIARLEWKILGIIMLYFLVRCLITQDTQDTEANNVPLRVWDGVTLSWTLFKEIVPMLFRWISPRFAHPISSPQNVYKLLSFLAEPSNLVQPPQVSVLNKNNLDSELYFDAEESTNKSCCWSVMRTYKRISYGVTRFFKRKEDVEMLLLAEKAWSQYNTLHGNKSPN